MSITKFMEELLHRTYVDIDGGQFEGDFGFKDIFSVPIHCLLKILAIYNLGI